MDEKEATDEYASSVEEKVCIFPNCIQKLKYSKDLIVHGATVKKVSRLRNKSHLSLYVERSYF